MKSRRSEDVVAGEVTSSWAGEKKAKIETAPASRCTGDSDEIVVHDQGPQQIEGFDWDKARLEEEIQKCYVQVGLHRALPDIDDDVFWAHHDEEGLRKMNQRLALYRLRGHKAELKDLSDAELMKMYPLAHLEEYGYYKFYEPDLEWYFDPQYCQYANLQDYQRLMLRHNGEYEEWDYYRQVCSTLESDQEFVMFWERLSNETKWIAKFLTASSNDWKRVAYYHTLKMAAGYYNIFKTLIGFCFRDYLYSVRFDNTWYKDIAHIFFEIWKRVVKEKVNFKDALEQVKDKALQSFCGSAMRCELTSNEKYPGPITCQYYNYMAHIDETVPEDEVQRLIMEAVKIFVPKHKVYYDYAKKKLDIASNIGLIPHQSIRRYDLREREKLQRSLHKSRQGGRQ
ncbi:hypothetical protein ACP70R_025669 [Stipagrostis hirtigluma subsp. patula]